MARSRPDPPTPDLRAHRYPLVDAMRGLAALSVLVYHVTFAFGYPRSTVWQYLSQRNAGPPVSAVIVFFLISGFVLYRPFAAARADGRPAPPLLVYAVHRIARIVPAYWAALAIVTGLLGLHYVLTPLGVIRYFGFLQLYGNWTVVNRGISPAWTLCVEVTFYALLPLLAIGVRRAARGLGFLPAELALCGSMVLASLAWQALIFALVTPASPWRLPLLLMLPGALDLFAAGMLLAALSVAVEARAIPPRWVVVTERAPWLWWIAAAAVFWAIGQMSGLTRHGLAAWWVPTHALKALGAGLLLVPLVFGAHRRTDWMRRLLASRPVLYLGAISYGVYLWHFPLLHKLAPDLVGHGELFTTLALAALTIAVASVSLFAVERPAQRLARAWLRGIVAAREPAPARTPPGDPAHPGAARPERAG